MHHCVLRKLTPCLMSLKLYYLIPLFLYPCLTTAQSSTATISGILKEQSGEPASYVAVILLTQDSTIAKTEVSGPDGSFNFRIKEGNYKLTTSSLQFQRIPTKSVVVVAGETKNLGTITLESSVTQLKEVQVTAVREMVEVHPDKTVFNIQGTVNSAGNDGIDLLSKAPGITLDNNENLIVMGKSGVTVYIDGKRSQLRGDDLLAMLRSLRSENIDAIEIITNPSSKYDAEGNAGIINIRLKRDQNLGWNGSVVGGYSIDLQDRYNGGITLNNRGKKYNLLASYTHYNNSAENQFNFDKTIGDVMILSRSVGVWNNKGHDMRLGSDLFLNKNHTFGVMLNLTLNDRNSNATTRAPFIDTGTGEQTQVMYATNNQEFDTRNAQANFNYQYKGNKGSTFNVDLDYGDYVNESAAFQPNDYYDADGESWIRNSTNANDTDTKIQLRSAKADYERKLGKGMLGAGVKFSSVDTRNIFDFFNVIVVPERDPTRSNTFNYDEEIAAAYANYSLKLGTKYNLNAGLRYEFTHSVGDLISEQQTENDRVEREYGNLFPNVGLTYDLDKKNKLGISYTKRIDRPNYQSLNPFEYKMDELNYVKGNPFLRPQYTGIYQVTYSWNNKLNVIFNHSISKDFSARVIELVEPPASVLIPRNLADSKNTAINASYPFDIFKWWMLRVNVNAFYAEYDGQLNGEIISLDVLTYNGSIQNTISLPKDLKFEVSGWYNSPSIWSGTIETSRLWAVNAGIRKGILKSQGQINVAVNDIFNSQRIYAYSNYGGILTEGNLRFNWQRLTIGLNYRFGNQKMKSGRNRKTGLEEEKNRLSEGQ